jgi:hypothetical protein
LSFPAGEAKKASSEARKAGEWIERESGEVSHSSNTRSWQRLHLLEVGKACSMVLCDIASSCANVPRLNHGERSNAATTTIAAPIPIFKVIESRTIIPSFFFKNTKQDAQKGRPAYEDRYLVYLVCLVSLVKQEQLDEQHKPDKPDEPDRPGC